MKKIIPLPAFMLLLYACAPRLERTTIKNIHGTWQWVRSDGGLGNHLHATPRSAEIEVQLQFTRKGYTIITNDSISSQGTYTLHPKESIRDHANKMMIDFSNPDDRDQLVEQTGNDTLILSDNVFDGVSSIYIRK